MSILRTAAALAAALTLSTAFAAPPPEVVELEGQWRGRLCTAEGNPTKTNLSIDKYGCFVLFQTDVNGAAQSAGTVTVKEGVMTLVDAKTGPYMVLKVSDDGRLVQDVRGRSISPASFEAPSVPRSGLLHFQCAAHAPPPPSGVFRQPSRSCIMCLSY